MATNSRTLVLDKLFVRDIVFKDPSNRPIAANKLLTTRGDGGIYFGDLPLSTNSTLTQSFNEVRAGSNIVFTASNAYNRLWLEAGAGIQYFSNTGKLYIAATGPEQISVVGDKTLNFSSLNDTLTGGRTLYFAGKGDTTVNVSATTILFGSAYVSTYSSIQECASTIDGILYEQSTLNQALNESINTVDTLLISSSVSTFWSTLQYTKDLAEATSSFVFSTFTESGLHITAVNTVNTNTSTINIGDQLHIGSNRMYDINVTGSNAEYCTIHVDNAIVSTYTNFLHITDDYTHTRVALEKEFLESVSTSAASTFITRAHQTQLGWFPSLSTQGSVLPSQVKDQFVPILQQIEVQDFIVGDSNVSTIRNYTLQNVARLDRICAPDELHVSAADVNISSMTLSSLNGLSLPALSSGQLFLTDTTIQLLRASTISTHSAYFTHIAGPSISSQYISSGILATNYANAKSLSTLNISAGTVLAGATIAQTTTVNALYANTASTGILSTGTLNFLQGFGSSLSVTAVSAGTMAMNSGAALILGASSLTASTLRAADVAAAVVSTQTLQATQIRATAGISTVGISSGTASIGVLNGQAVNALTISTGSAYLGVLDIKSISTLHISSGTGYVSVFAAQTLTADSLRARSASTVALSTGTIAFDTGRGALLNTSVLNAQTASTGQHAFGKATGGSLSTLHISTGGLYAGLLQSPAVITTTLQASHINATSSLSTQRISTGAITFNTGVAQSINVQTCVATIAIMDKAYVNHLSSLNMSTGALRYGTATGSLLTASNATVTSALTLNTASAASISTARISTGTVAFGSAVGNTGTFISAQIGTLSTGVLQLTHLGLPSLSSLRISTGALYFQQGSVSNLQVQQISAGTAVMGAAVAATTATTQLSTAQLTTSSITANVISAPVFTTTTLTSRELSTVNISTGNLSFRIASGTTATVNTLVASNATVTAAAIASARVSALSTLYISAGSAILELAECELLEVQKLRGASVSTLQLSTGRFSADVGTADRFTVQLLNVSSFQTSNITCSSVTTHFISSGKVEFGLALGTTISTAIATTTSLNYTIARGHTLNSQNVSSGNIVYGEATGKSISTAHISSGKIYCGLGEFDRINVRLISTGGFSFNELELAQLKAMNISSGFTTVSTLWCEHMSVASMSTSRAHVDSLIFTQAVGDVMSTLAIQTGDLYGTSATLTSNVSTVLLSASNVTTSDLYGTSATLTSNVSTVLLSASNVTTSDLYGTSATLTSNVSTVLLSASNINAATATLNTISTLTMQTGTLVANYIHVIYTSSINISTAVVEGQTATFTDYVSTATVYANTLNASNITAAEGLFTSNISTIAVNASNAIIDTLNTSTVMISTIYGSPNPLMRFNINTSSISINALPSQVARATVDVNGVVYAEKFVITSDRRLKSDLKILEPPTSIPPAYRYVLNETGESDIGVLADEVEPFAPECIYTRPDGYKAVNYMKLVPICLSLIKSLMERMDAFERSSSSR